MNKVSIYCLKLLRKIYIRIFHLLPVTKPDCIENPETASQVILNALISEKSCMIARFGSTELTCLCNYIGIKMHDYDVFGYIKGETNAWWWDKSILSQMQQWSGFFPPTQEKIEQFCELMLQDIPEVDVLGSWLTDEKRFESLLGTHEKVNLELINPYFSVIPWTKALESKKVLVIHPFAKTIEKQYKNRELLFEKEILPKFELKTIHAVQSIAGEKTPYADWFEALDWMKSEIDKQDYDICLIGCGAYGFPLAAHVKRRGKKAVHMGGSLQLLFGIRGKRWENPQYGAKEFGKEGMFTNLINKHWVKPDEDEKPKNAQIVEGACYW